MPYRMVTPKLLNSLSVVMLIAEQLTLRDLCPNQGGSSRFWLYQKAWLFCLCGQTPN